MRTAWRACLCTLLLIPLLGSAGAPAPTSPLERAKEQYRRFQFSDCLASLDIAAGQPSAKADLAVLEIYRGLCSYGLSERSQAIDHFQTAVKLDPTAQLPPFSSPKIRQFFDSAVQGVRPKTPPAEHAAPSLVPKAAPPNPEAKSLGAEVITGGAAAPPPASALRPLPLVLFGAGALAVVGYSYFGLRAKHHERAANAAFYQSEALVEGDRARQQALLANISLGVAAIGIGAGVMTFALGGEESSAP